MNDVIKAVMPNPITPENSNIRKCCPEEAGRYKHIEEMIKETMKVCEIDNQCGSCHWSTCNECLSEVLYKAGYRKSTDVAEEIFEEIERYLRLNEDIAIKCKEENGEQNREYFKGKLAAYLQIRGFVDVELKRQYKEGQK